MPWYKGQPYTGFRGVDLKGSTYIRLHGDATGASGTLTFDQSEGVDRAWEFPNKDGKFAIGGTFVVNLPAINAATLYETLCVVSGIREEDALVCQCQDINTTITTRWPVVLANARPFNGAVQLVFVNPSAGSNYAARRCVVAYTAVR